MCPSAKFNKMVGGLKLALLAAHLLGKGDHHRVLLEVIAF